MDFRSRRTLSAGTASAASFAALRPGSSARAVPAGVAAFHYNPLFFGYKTHLAICDERTITAATITTGEKSDGHYLKDLIEKSRTAGMEVGTVLGDAAYSGKDNLVYAQKEKIQLISKLNPILNGTRTKEFDFNKDAGMFV